MPLKRATSIHPWVSYDPSNPVWNTHANNKVTLWKLQSLVQPLHRHRRKWMGWQNGVYFFSPEMELAKSERRVSMAYDICFSGVAGASVASWSQGLRY